MSDELDQREVSLSRLSKAQIEGEADELRKLHGLTSIPVDPVALARAEGIQVFNAKFSDDGLSGVIARRGTNVSILVNQSDSANRKRFTIAHELGHHFLHLMSHDGDYVDGQIDLFRDDDAATANNASLRAAEVQANIFASALLMPQDAVLEAYKQNANVETLAQWFNVSTEAMGYRLRRLGLNYAD